MRYVRFFLSGAALAAFVASFAGCAPERSPAGGDPIDASVHASMGPSTPLAESPSAHARIEELRGRFLVRSTARGVAKAGSPPLSPALPAFGAPAATGFLSQGDRVRAVLPEHAKHGVARSATVTLPARANAPVSLVDDTSHLSVSFTLRGASDAPVASGEGYALYAGALGGADVVHRVHAEGTEDYVVFETKPAKEELAYDVDVTRVAGLRLLSNTLEFLDGSGSPRLRVAPPYVVDAKGVAAEATLHLDGCAFDGDPRAPWGRSVTAPGASSCVVRVAWSATAYPAVVDPSWVATGSLAMARSWHVAVSLSSGNVLVAGGAGPSGALSSSELYNPTAGSFSATGSMTAARTEFGAAALQSGSVLVAGGVGVSSLVLSSAEVYDPVTGTFASTAPMTYSAEGATVTTLLNGKALVAGGYNYGDLTAADVYDPVARSFAATASLTTGRFAHTATLLSSGEVLIVGGQSDNVANVSLTSAELYDPVAATFMPTGSMAFQRSYHTATALGSGKVLVAGGEGTTGDGATIQSSGELYDPAAGTFAPLSNSMSTGREYHTATLLASGKVLLAGGDSVFNGGLTTATADLYDPASGTFAATATMKAARQQHTASLLASGHVLVAGGFNSGVHLSSAEIYDVLSAGSACGTGDDCASGICVDGICCAAACPNDGVCGTCASGTGVCVATVNADDPDNCTGASTCNASGTCGLKNGQPATSGTSCASGFASDGVCCNVACNSPCDVCSAALGAMANGVPADGTCSPAPLAEQYAGNPACGTGVVCDGTDVACPVPCTSDIDCAATYYCSANGSCQPQKGQGDTCNTAAAADCRVSGCRECSTPGGCVDGMCCDSACTGSCNACNVAGFPGQCTNVAGGSPGNPLCAPYLCTGSSAVCPAGCELDSQCMASDYCNMATSACVPKQGQGASCTFSVQCSSGNCTGGMCVGLSVDGTPCTTSDDCQNDNCVEGTGAAGSGICCHTACPGACASCATGVCNPLPVGSAGSPSCSPDECDGVNATCPTKCTSDLTCIASDYCDVGSGTCGPKLDNGKSCTASSQCVNALCVNNICVNNATSGTPCTSNDQCSSGYCVADVCCLSLCAGACSSCASGSCQAVTKGTAGAPTCSPLVCDGNGQACPASCTDDTTCIASDYCNVGSGRCVAKLVTGSTCSSDDQCLGGLCAANLCVANTPNGHGCAGDEDCLSGFCVDGVCCVNSCNFSCASCATGSCVPVAIGSSGSPSCTPGVCDGNDKDCPASCTDDTTCITSDYCNTGSSKCVAKQASGKGCSANDQCASDNCVAGVCSGTQKNSTSCTKGDQCNSGVCSDGVCCDRACDGQCEACDVTLGVCSQVNGTPHGSRSSCQDTGETCGATCSATGGTKACVFAASGKACGSASCSKEKSKDVVTSACDGNGACVSRAPAACPGNFACDATTNECPTSCTVDTECATGFKCAGNQCVPAQGSSVCKDDHTAMNSNVKGNGGLTDCTPYTCEQSTGECRKSCMSVSDCAAPATCGSDDKCVAPPTSSSGSSGGCAMAPSSEGSSRTGGATWLFATIALVAATRRRRAALDVSFDR